MLYLYCLNLTCIGYFSPCEEYLRQKQHLSYNLSAVHHDGDVSCWGCNGLKKCEAAGHTHSQKQRMINAGTPFAFFSYSTLDPKLLNSAAHIWGGSSLEANLSIFKRFCVCMCVLSISVFVCPQRPKEDVRLLIAGIIGNCKSPNMAVQKPNLWKNIKCS